MTELIHSSWGSSTHSALTRMGAKLKIDTVLNDETSEIERERERERERVARLVPSGGGGTPAPI